MDQHSDEYPNKYFNYKPVKIERVDSYPARPNETTETLFANLNKRKTTDKMPKLNEKFEAVWDLDNESIGFGLKLFSKNYSIKKHEQLHICYGERANSFLLIEYGFAIPDNRFDFVRRSNLTLASFYGDLMVLSQTVKGKFYEKLDELGLKDTL